MPLGCYFAVLDIQYTELENGYQIVVTTDTPCHLWMRWSYHPPQYHTVPHYRRGIYLHADRYICFTVYKDNEQEEPGDTYIHTFIKTGWPSCWTRWFYFWGTVGAMVCKSTSCVFEKHFMAPLVELYRPTWHNRSLYATSGTWSSARNGAGVKVVGVYQRPLDILQVSTSLVATYFIYRSWLNFNTPALPPGKTILSGRLGLYITAKEGTTGGLGITKGLVREPIDEDAWALQTAETTLLGYIFQDDIIPDRYNWLPLTQAGIDWFRQSELEIKQQESYDWFLNAYGIFYGHYRWFQTFTPLEAHTFRIARLRLKRKGDAGDLIVNIKATDANHKPTGDILAQAQKASIFLSTDTWGDWFYLVFDKYVSLTDGVEYCFECWTTGGNSNNWVQWIGASGNQYPNGTSGYSLNDGGSWTMTPTNDWYFIEYEVRDYTPYTGEVVPMVGGTNFCLRTLHDINDSAPGAGVILSTTFNSAQVIGNFEPKLELTLGDA